MIWKQNENTTAKKRSLFCVCIHTCTLQHNVQARKFEDNGRTEETLQPDVMDSVFATPNKAQSYLQKCGKATLRWVYVCIFFIHLRQGLHLSDEETRARYARKTSHREDESAHSTALPQSHWEKTVWDTQFPGRGRLASYSSFQDLTRRASPPPYS